MPFLVRPAVGLGLDFDVVKELPSGRKELLGKEKKLDVEARWHLFGHAKAFPGS